MTAEEIYEYINYFTDIQEMPKEDKNSPCIYICNDGDGDIGFSDAMRFEELGLHMLTASKYITETNLLKLIEE